MLINGTPVATMGSMTAHGGSIVVGEPIVMVSSATPNKKAYTPLAEIQRPEFKRIEVLLNKGKDLVSGSKNAEKMKEAKAAQDKVDEEAKAHGFVPDFEFSV